MVYTKILLGEPDKNKELDKSLLLNHHCALIKYFFLVLFKESVYLSRSVNYTHLSFNR